MKQINRKNDTPKRGYYKSSSHTFFPKLGLLLLGEAMLKICKTTAYKDNQALVEKGNRQRMQEEKKS